MSGSDEVRCFWATLTKAPPGVAKRIFVPLCSTALHSGDPDDCSCDRWPTRIEALQAEIGATRRRAKRAEEALAAREVRLARERVRLAGYRKRIEAGRRPSPARVEPESKEVGMEPVRPNEVIRYGMGVEETALARANARLREPWVTGEPRTGRRIFYGDLGITSHETAKRIADRFIEAGWDVTIEGEGASLGALIFVPRR